MKPSYSSRLCFAIVILGAFTQAWITYSLAVTRLYTYKTSIVDLGVFNQLLHRAAQGLPMATAIFPPYAPQPWFGFHFSPILYLLAPIYALWPAPETLLAVQSLLMAAAAPLLFRIGLRLGLELGWAVLFSLLALVNPYLFSAALYDFHEIAFAVPLLCCVAWALLSGRFGWLVAACLGLLLTKEHYGLSVIGAGLAWGIRHKDWRRGGALACGGAVAAVLVLVVIMPAVSPFHAHAMTMTEQGGLDRFGWIRSGHPVSALYTILFETTNYNFPGFVYLALALGTVGFLPVAAPLVLLAGSADLVANLLSSRQMMRVPVSYHNAPLVPLLIVAAMIGWQKLERRTVRIALVTVGAIVSLVLTIPLGPANYWEIQRLASKPAATDQAALAALATGLRTCRVPAVQASIAALLPPIDSEIPFLGESGAADCIALHLYFPYARMDRGMLSSPYAPLSIPEFIRSAEAVLNRPDWKVAYWNEGFLLLNREAIEMPGARAAAIAQLKSLADQRAREIGSLN